MSEVLDTNMEEELNAQAGPSSIQIAEIAPTGVELNPDGTPKLSKSAMKKAAKRARAESEKLVRRAAEKERRKANAAKRRADMQAGLLSKEEMEDIQKRQEEKRLRKRIRSKGGNVVKDDEATWKGGIVVDCGFDELMNGQEIVSMTNQLYFVHALNRMSPKPFRHCAFTGINGRMKERLDTKLNGEYAKFTRLEWRGEDVNDMRQAPARSEEEWTAFTNSKRVGRKTVTGGRGPVDLAETPLRNPFDGQEYIYLSADADYELETLKENETYIIGGIVDRNRYKNLCQDKATKMGIKTARLPIGKYLADMPTRKVLTVNQVFEILLKYNELGSWQAAMEAVMPQRKYQIGGKRALRKLEERQKAGTEAEDKDEDGNVDANEENDDGEDERVPEAVAGMQPHSGDESDSDDGGQDVGIDEEAMANEG